jgi:hypothetical protein
MASEAQVLANRRNAEKSTGPRTEEGKAISSQNAVTHGLTADRDVIGTEDQAQFDLHREQMMGELRPLGPVETMFAERAISLSWRLKRAERMQNEALDYLLAEDGSGPAGESDELGSFLQRAGSGEGDPALGRVVVQDFAAERVLERLMMYERRIEMSLLRTMNELHTMKMCRRMERQEDEVRRWNMEHGCGASHPSPEPRPPTPSSKTNPISGWGNERGGRWEERRAELAVGMADGKTNPIPDGTIDFLPEAEPATMIVASP